MTTKTMPVEVISRKDLETLLEYSCSLPTGTTIGKRWRRDTHFNTPRKPDQTIEPEWQIGEYYELPPGQDKDARGNDLVGIHWYWAVDENHEVHRGKL